MTRTVALLLLSVSLLLVASLVQADLPPYHHSGLPLRDGMEASLRSMYRPIEGGVVCPTCLLAYIHSRNMDQFSETFKVAELAARLAKYPADGQEKLKALKFGTGLKTTFEGSAIHIGSSEGTRSTYFGMAQRTGDIVKVAMIKGEVFGALVPKYHTYEVQTCYRHWLFWTKCDTHSVAELRGHHGHELEQMDAALMSETLRLFHSRLGYITM